MLVIRRFEEAVNRLFLRGEIYGSTHLCIGQEAVSVGVVSVLRPQDWVAATYRGHGHSLALGVDPRQLMAEMLGRVTGTCGGRAGSMNVVDLRHRLVGCFGIVGGSIAAATGAGLTQKLNPNLRGISVAFFGDGAANQAYFLECLNFAKVQQLPVVYVCENNQYGEYTPTKAVTPGGILARAAALQIPARAINGNDVWGVREAARWARRHALTTAGPCFLEAATYRFSGHGRGDPVEYRPPGELDMWRKRDPLLLAEKRLKGLGVSEDQLQIVDQLAVEFVANSEKIALDDAFPRLDGGQRQFKPDPNPSDATVCKYA